MKQSDKQYLTAENGRPIADNQNTQTEGVRGPVALQDPWLTERLAHFDREVIPERRMHAKDFGPVALGGPLRRRPCPSFVGLDVR